MVRSDTACENLSLGEFSYLYNMDNDFYEMIILWNDYEN